MLPIFGGSSIKHIFLRKQKNYVLSALSRQKLCYFSIFKGFSIKSSQFSLAQRHASKSVFRETSKGPRTTMRGWGPQPVAEKGPPAILDPPPNTDKYVRTPGTRPKLCNKIISWEKSGKNLKNAYASHARAGVPDVCTNHFLLQIAFTHIFVSWKFV